MQYIFEKFDSVAQFIKTIDERPHKKDWYNEDSHTGSEDFTGTESYEAATKLAVCGDNVSAAKVAKNIKKLRSEKAKTEQRVQRSIIRTVAGSRPCVPAAVIGHPCSMYRRKDYKVNKPVVSVYYSVSMSGGTDAAVLVEAGAKMAEAIQIVERSGVRVNLYVGNTSRTSSQLSCCFVRVKDSAKDFELLRMAYPVVNPSFFRRHWFRWCETKESLKTREWRDGYGRPLRTKEEESEALKNIRNNDKCDFLFTTRNVVTSSAEDIAKEILGN